MWFTSVILWLWWADQQYGGPTKPTAVEFIQTQDDWRLAVDVHRVDGERRGVVVTCHGLGANRYNLDLAPGLSLVESLVEQDWEVWNVDLRGNGNSQLREGPWRRRLQWSYDDHVRYDVPAILDAVITRSGAGHVHWIGHSMGGMVMYGHLGRHPEEERVASVCAVGSPARFELQGVINPLARFGRWFGRLGLPLPVQWTARLTAPVAVRVPFDIYVAKPTNLSDRAVRRILTVLSSPLSAKMIHQTSRWVTEKSFDSDDGVDDYGANLSRIVTPFCLISGVDDRLAPPSSVLLAYDAMVSPIKVYHELGRESGAQADHCHGSLLLGETAKDDVFPIIHGWLDEREQDLIDVEPVDRAAE